MPSLYGDLVANGDFTSGLTNWWAGDPAMITIDAPGAGVDATASTDAVQLWDAPFGQDGVTLRTGCSYTLSFTARASQPGAVLRAKVGLGAVPWTVAIEQTVSLPMVDTHFVLPFTAALDTAAGQVAFHIGQASPVTVHLTDVRLTCSTVREGFFVDPASNPAKWVADNPADPRAPQIAGALARRPIAKWFGDWTADIQSAVDAHVTGAAAVGKLPILTVYNMVNRDLGGESRGGAATPALYRTWIESVAAGIGGRPALVIVEPDSLAQIGHLPIPEERTERYGLVAYAAQTLSALPFTQVYLDGGHATWTDPAEQAARLKAAGVEAARGFAVGVASFHATDVSCLYGQQVAEALAGQGVPGARFVVDTSRNGNGGLDQDGAQVDYCNPAGRRLGPPSSIGVGGAEYLLWIKAPGDSDGQCGVAPPGTPAGTFSPYLAQRLIEGW
ncbi:glycoside hydrolase family 6 protein [Streptomyces sp. NPDC057638]|uniref:glycoside hydrolase family 6 protein n=1 Tax=Streptomyces sp. NPDC057638 TaxID=3346190 RepID=UPI0036CAB086